MPSSGKMKEFDTKIAVIGAGRWGRNLIRVFDTLTPLVACSTSGNNPDNINWLKGKYPNIPRRDYSDILDDPEIQAVAIATPIKEHKAMSLAALQKGKHVLVEKPPTTNHLQALKLYQLAEDKGIIFATDNLYLSHPAFTEAQRVLQSDRPISADFQWEKFGTFDEDIFWNLAYHQVYLAIALFGNPQAIPIVRGSGGRTEVDKLQFSFAYIGNQNCSFAINRLNAQENFRVVTIRAAGQTLRWQDEQLFREDQQGDEMEIKLGENSKPLNIVCRDFLTRIKKGETKDPKRQLVLDTIETIEDLKKRYSKV